MNGIWRYPPFLILIFGFAAAACCMAAFIVQAHFDREADDKDRAIDACQSQISGSLHYQLELEGSHIKQCGMTRFQIALLRDQQAGQRIFEGYAKAANPTSSSVRQEQ